MKQKITLDAIRHYGDAAQDSAAIHYDVEAPSQPVSIVQSHTACISWGWPILSI
ncbi:hypothetical protein [Paenibacillus glycanilyticus]|uniref:Uncharacterized protein n=1 Tax=Paenibacillus glycanilyticus TaxID=126569 RepID=A0ABQ6GI83_9BACL|nr:hypothetical protein [Paenibacillus glycanilyticus]GLX70651.1 hypothetical protein MU1_49970 [Paenibacillus glycanilyticus]